MHGGVWGGLRFSPRVCWVWLSPGPPPVCSWPPDWLLEGTLPAWLGLRTHTHTHVKITAFYSADLCVNLSIQWLRSEQVSVFIGRIPLLSADPP